MGGIVLYTIWAAIILTGLSMLTIIVFGIRGLTYGNMDNMTLALLAIPTTLIVVLGLIMDTWAEAFIMVFLIMLVLTSLALLVTSFRGLIGL